MCARSLGSGRVDEACRIFSVSCLTALVLSGTMAAVGIVFAGPFAQLLGARGASAELLPYAKNFLIGLFMGTPANVLPAVISPIVQLDGSRKRAAVASFAVAVVDVAGNVLFMVVLKLGLLGRSTADRGVEKPLFLPRDFGVPEEDCISVTVTGMDGVVGLSRTIWAFCDGHGVDRRRCFLASLCIEEMAGNTVLHGFTDGKKHSVDILVILNGDDILLRLRDDCRRFDLKEKVKNWTPDPERPEENIGIRMVLGLAKDVAYTNTMNMNNLLITI